MDFSDTDQQFMKLALSLAKKAGEAGEVPVGAVITHSGKVIAESMNCRESTNSPTGHAELLAIENAAQKLGQWRLIGCTLYVTLEPCLMCAGAIINARVDRVVFAVTDPKAGAVVSLYQTLGDHRLNHRPQIEHGLYAEESSQLLKSFFQRRRTENSSKN